MLVKTKKTVITLLRTQPNHPQRNKIYLIRKRYVKIKASRVASVSQWILDTVTFNYYTIAYRNNAERELTQSLFNQQENEFKLYKRSEDRPLKHVQGTNQYA